MAKNKNSRQTPVEPNLITHLELLGLPFMRENYDALALQAAQKSWTHVDYLAALADGEAGLRRERSIKRRIRLARFPVIKTLEHCSAGLGRLRSTVRPSKISFGSSS